MQVHERPFSKLILSLKEKFTNEKNAEMVALLTAAEYQQVCLDKIVRTKFSQAGASLASEALTTSDYIAEKLNEVLQ